MDRPSMSSLRRRRHLQACRHHLQHHLWARHRLICSWFDFAFCTVALQYSYIFIPLRLYIFFWSMWTSSCYMLNSCSGRDCQTAIVLKVKFHNSSDRNCSGSIHRICAVRQLREHSDYLCSNSRGIKYARSEHMNSRSVAWRHSLLRGGRV
jgi:hypothetical protein